MHNIHNQNNTEGSWDGKAMKIAAAENGTSANIRKALKHCAKKPDVKVAVIFSLDDLTRQEIRDGISRFNGLKNHPKQWKQFDEIVFVFKSGTIKKHHH